MLTHNSASGGPGVTTESPSRSRRLPVAQDVTLGFGAAGIGNLYRAVSDSDAAKTLEAAWSAGIRYFDTAPHYGLGLSERRLGDFLRQFPRDSYTLSTKVGRVLESSSDGGMDDQGFVVPRSHVRRWDFSASGVDRSLDASATRLRTDRFDVVHVHDPDDHFAWARDEALPHLGHLRETGVVGSVGVGMNQSAMLTRFVETGLVDVVMLAGRYTLLEQDALDDVLPAAERAGVSVVAAAIFNSGLLARRHPGADARYDYGDAPPAVLERARQLADVCDRHGTTLPAAALAFPQAHPAVSRRVVGASSVREVEENVAAASHAVTADLWQELKGRHLLRLDAPVPTQPG